MTGLFSQVGGGGAGAGSSSRFRLPLPKLKSQVTNWVLLVTQASMQAAGWLLMVYTHLATGPAQRAASSVCSKV